MDDGFNNLYEFADCRFDGVKGKLWRGGELILLSPKASELLNLLLERGGEYVSKEEIFEKVWKDTFVEDGVLTQNIYKLRKAVGTDADGKPLIENKTRLGYRIIAPVFVKEEEKRGKGEREKKNAEKRTAFLLFSLSLLLPFLIILAIVAAFFTYRYFTSEAIVTTSRLEKIRIQKITDTGDIFFPTLSADGNFAAYAKDPGSSSGSIYIKDLNANSETKLNITNVKRFGFLRFSGDGNYLYLRNRASSLIPADVLKVSRFGGEAAKIAENVWSGFSLSPDDQQIVFIRSFPNEIRQTLVIKNLETNVENEILSANSPEIIRLRSFPEWSADGKQIAVIFERQNQGFDKIVIYDLKTKSSENLQFKNFTQVEYLHWIPNKNALLVSAREAKFYQLWEISVADKKASRITNDLNNYLSLNLSADGKRLLTTQNNFFTNLWTLEGENLNTEKQITFGISNRDGYSGIDCFSTGEIVYTSNEGDSGEVDLWRVNPANGERRQLTKDAGKRNENPAISPDEKYIYFASDRGGKSAIWQIEPNGENPKQITSGENSNDAFPQISPDGTWLYFIRKTAKTSAVFRKSLTENREEQLTESAKFAPANYLALSPDGRFLAFHNLTEKIQADNPQQVHQVAVIETENPGSVKNFNIGGRIPYIFWTADGIFFDYMVPSKDGDEIRRQNFTEAFEPQVLRKFPKEEIYFLQHSPDGKTIVARGRQQTDAVLLTNFE